jgi:Leucine-rich repeat (LRR) protein
MNTEQLVERRIKEAKENRSTDLYLSHCNLIQVPEEVFELDHLHHLDLRHNRLVYLPKELSKLSHLKGLYLNNNRLKELPDELTGLEKLQVLKVEGNRLKRLPEEISRLKNLRYLYLSGNHLRALPAGLFHLQRLKVFTASNNRLEALPEDIGRLDHLEVLDLNNNRLSRLPREISHLNSLQLLYLSRNQLMELPLELFHLTHLIRLDLNFNRLRALSDDISLLVSLQILNLEGNRLDRLSGEMFQLENLSILNLDGNRIGHLPEEIFLLKKLEYLSMSDNRLKKLPKEITHLKNLVYSGINKNPLEIPPIEIANRGIDAIRNYFKQLEVQGEAFLYEADVILVGETGAGKTTLRRKLLDSSFEPDPEEPPTLGIDVKAWEFPLSESLQLKANIRDFGGEKSIRYLDSFFLTKRSIYVVVLDNREDDSDFYYWYDFVELLTSQKLPVIIVFNRKYDNMKQIPAAVLANFTHMPDVFIVNLADNTGWIDLIESIRRHLKALPHVGKEPIPAEWVKIRQALTVETRPFIEVERFLDICKEHGITDKEAARHIGEFLHDLGFIIHFSKDPLLRKIIILDPRWPTEAIYRVLSNETMIKEGGRLDKSLLKKIWDTSPYMGVRSQLLNLMNNMELCYELGESGQYLVPSMLYQNSPGVSLFQNIPDAHLFRLRYRYSFMPKGILSRLMVRMSNYIYGKMQWRGGVLLHIGDAVAELLENRYPKELRIRISGESRAEALALLRKEIKALHDTYHYLEPLELIPCNCSQCVNRRNPRFYSYRLLKKYRQKGRYKVVCETSLEDVVIYGLIGELSPPPNQQPTQLDGIIRFGDNRPEIAARRSKILVAYSSIDSQWLERVRTHLREFEDEGFELDVWDDIQLNAGEKWEREIEEVIREIKIVILLISTDFLAADCIVNNELPPLLETAERDGAVILPLILKPSRFIKNPHMSQFQPVNDPEKPLIVLDEGRQEEVLIKLTEAIEDNLRDINPSLTR